MPMNHKNTTLVSEFFLRGFSSQPEVETLLFPLFLLMYLLTILGNVTIILLIRCDRHLLQTPMYFFLSHLAVADLGFASTIVPKALQNLLSQRKTISYHGCLAQMFFYIHIGNADSYLLASMAYDRYVAICSPLNYSIVMSHKRCLQLATLSWTITMFHSLIYTFLMSRVEFCDPGEIPHFFCDLYPVLDVSCSDSYLIDLVLMTEGIVEILGPFVLIIISYALIFYSIVKIPSATGKRKAFSTCGSHICVVVMYFGGISFVYFKPNSNLAERHDTWAAMMYTMVNPMVNPFIYSLRNNEMKAAMKRVIRKHFR
ncbi:PREDICTED: olfactory receptor-like protein DTMT [Gekko japonicus]|uniref:Olfactory receptor n=1 Tax=Gekko japonicus TaxID=146911 RepID=A0ABM1K4M2_GEKJA|nr:PREDICTED: olfactory receptor-like protein DTMT [Gekko japonicus]